MPIDQKTIKSLLKQGTYFISIFSSNGSRVYKQKAVILNITIEYALPNFCIIVKALLKLHDLF